MATNDYDTREHYHWSKITWDGLSHWQNPDYPKELDRAKSETLGDALSNITGVSTLKVSEYKVKPVIQGLQTAIAY